MKDLKDSVTSLIRQLNPKDQCAIVSYATDVTIDFPLTAMDLVGKAAAVIALEGVKPSGKAWMSEGLRVGFEELKSGASGTTANGADACVMLVSDGAPTKGAIDAPSLASELSKHAANNLGGYHSVTLNTYGLTKKHEKPLLQALANVGGDADSSLSHTGRYYDLPKLIGDAFDASLEALMSRSAKIVASGGGGDLSAQSMNHGVTGLRLLRPHVHEPLEVFFER